MERSANAGLASRSLARLEAVKPAIIVPRHGPTEDGTLFFTGYRSYLEGPRSTEAEKRVGRSLDQTVAAVTAAFGDRAPDKGRLSGAIRPVFAETP